MPRGGPGDDGVDEDKKLAGAGDESDFVFFAFGSKALVEGLELGIPVESCGEGGGVEAGSQARASAPNVALSGSVA